MMEFRRFLFIYLFSEMQKHGAHRILNLSIFPMTMGA